MDHDGSTAGRAVVVGCGDLGTRIGLRLHARGHDVDGWRRSPERLPAEIRGVAADLLRPADLPELPEDTSTVVFTPSAGERSAARYRAVLHDGLAAVLERIAAMPAPRPRLIVIGSTSVHGGAEGRLDEESPLTPASPTAEVLVQVEELVVGARTHGITASTLRLSGIYGPGRRRLISRIEAFDGGAEARERLGDPLRISNRIHVDDAALAACTLAGVEEPPGVLIGVDEMPIAVGEVHNWLADRLDRPRPWPELDPDRAHGRRMDGSRLHGLLAACGTALRHRDYRSGYALEL
ncbi:NAD-dependent epimerase/dehydratase family protein [Nesterenkonia marinintestina]|uniref:NAD-dependent epimerase/dehydratase family protein n=1 Tax=Nesterenkonia marinintestina TaxID=2979865 RepID=UPI0021BE1DDE|nr:NAD-dependent epimerase/dehydratase family protein [Nesterenkonia sp. GX14115]